jgi:hypothetical protein
MDRGRTLRLVAVPVLISAAVTALRLTGELLRWSGNWFSTETGGTTPHGLSWVVGITWLPIFFGPYFARALWKGGDRPTSVSRAAVVSLAGFVAAEAGTRLLAPLVSLPFPRILLVIWAAYAAGAAIQIFAWPGLVRVLLVYGLGSRLVVAAIMFFAMLGNWGTHYDYVGMPAPFQMPFWPRFLWLAFFPQLVFWVGFTAMLGTLSGSLYGRVRFRQSDPSGRNE